MRPLGKIDPAFLGAPAKVMQVSMRVNQRYFAPRNQDRGAASTAGNERVLRAQFSGARHFWDLDRKIQPESRASKLDAVNYYANLGTQGDRMCRRKSMPSISPRWSARTRDVARLCKAEFAAGTVAEFSELQDVMDRYYNLKRRRTA